MGRIGGVALALALVATGAGAQEIHADAAGGFETLIPDGFDVIEAAPGRVVMEDATARLWLEAEAYDPDAGFRPAVAAMRDALAAEGWEIRHEDRRAGWETFEALRGGRVVHTTVLGLCDEGRLATLRLDYPEAEQRERNPLIGQLEGYFEPVGC